MGAIELKNEFHNLIDKIDDTVLLEKFFHIMEEATNQGSSHSLLDNLSDVQRAELLLSIEESEDINNLIAHDEMIKKHNKWL